MDDCKMNFDCESARTGNLPRGKIASLIMQGKGKLVQVWSERKQDYIRQYVKAW